MKLNILHPERWRLRIKPHPINHIMPITYREFDERLHNTVYLNLTYIQEAKGKERELRLKERIASAKSRSYFK